MVWTLKIRFWTLPARCQFGVLKLHPDRPHRFCRGHTIKLLRSVEGNLDPSSKTFKKWRGGGRGYVRGENRAKSAFRLISPQISQKSNILSPEIRYTPKILLGKLHHAFSRSKLYQRSRKKKLKKNRTFFFMKIFGLKKYFLKNHFF